jgi:hypothetical protein
MAIPINYLTVSRNIILNTKLALTSDNWTHWYETVGITPSAIYKLTTGFRHRPLFLCHRLCFEMFRAIKFERRGHASSGETLSSSRVLSLSSYILSRLSMIAGSNVGVLTYLYLHLYPHMTNPTDRCSFSYLVNFMPAVVGLALSNYVASCSVRYIFHSKFCDLQFHRGLLRPFSLFFFPCIMGL